MAAPLQDNEKDALIARLQNENRSLIQEQSMLGLNYNHKKEDGIEARHLANGDIPIFTRVPELSTMKPNEDIDHLLIEGDNLPALVALLPTYRNKVNVIYIDPPYNTGNQDFVYNDRYVDSEDGFRHSKWLSFMKSRLQLAHEMLSDDGVIFVSIDDHEQAYLRVLMDEVFGEDNFVANLVVETGNANGPKTTHKGKTIFKVKEYLLFYKKGGDLTIEPSYDYTYDYDHNYNRIFDKDSRKLYTYQKYVDELGVSNKEIMRRCKSGALIIWREMRDFSSSTKKFLPKVKNGEYEVVVDVSETYKVIKVRSARDSDVLLRWQTDTDLLDMVNMLAPKLDNKEQIKTLRGDLWKGYNKEYGSNLVHESAGIQFKNGQKSLKFVKDVINICPSKNALILDFFAGSGTTGQAVAELNKEDGGHRKCILVTNNFEQDGAPNGIARDITSVRMKRVLTGREWADGKEHEPLPGNLIYYRLDWQPMSTSLTNLPGMLPLSTFLGSLSINQQTHRLMDVPDDMPTLSKLVKDGHAALLTTKNNKHMVLALDADTSDDFDALDTVKAELEGASLLEGLDVAMESGFDTDTYMDSGVFDHELTFPVPDIIQMQATVKMLKKDGVISINDNQEDHTHMNNDNKDNK